MKTTRLLLVAPIIAMLLTSACATAVVLPPPTETPTITASPVPPTATTIPTIAPTATALPTATASPSVPPSPTFIPTPAPTWTPTPITPTSTRPPATITPTRPPATPTMTYTPDPLGSRQDRISGVLSWHGTPIGNIPVDLYTDAGVWCGKRPALAHTQTDGSGRYIFLDVQPGRYWLSFNSNNMDSGPGAVPSYTWICTEVFAKEQTARIYDTVLSKTDLELIYPTAGISFNNPYPMFAWQAYPEAAYYTIILDYITDKYNKLENDTRVDGLAFVPRAPLAVGKYHLRVYAWDARKTRLSYGDVNFAVQ